MTSFPTNKTDVTIQSFRETDSGFPRNWWLQNLSRDFG